MCKCANKMTNLALLIVLPLLLSACGGAPSEAGSSQSSSAVINKPEASSAASSISVSSTAESTISSAGTTSKSSSSEAASSVQRNSRVSRASSSATSVDNPTGADLTVPGATSLQLYRLSESSITLVWNDAIDNVGISHYIIERNGGVIASLDYPTNIIIDQNLSAGTDYSYTITAFDLSANNSEASPVFTVRTLGNPNSSAASSVKSSVASSQKSSSSSKSLSSSSKSLSSSSKSQSSTSSSKASQKSAKITWNHPNQRENGQFLELYEIGGYEIRYRKLTDSRYTYIVINSNKITEYTHADATDTEFEIAVFDTNGVYSRFVKVTQ